MTKKHFTSSYGMIDLNLKKHAVESTQDIQDIWSKATSGTSITGDWQRNYGNEKCNTKVNGVSMREYFKIYNKFKFKEDIEKFIRNVLLRDVPEGKVKGMIPYLIENFHQGGLMFPVSSPLSSTTFLETVTNQKMSVLSIGDGDLNSEVNIVTTSAGFKIQEFANVKSFTVSPYASEKYQNLRTDDYRIQPEKDKKYIVEAQATINIDLLNPKEPMFTIESNTINFGHPIIEQTLDKRLWYEALCDFFKYYLGMNKIKSLAPEEPDEQHGSNYR